MFFGKYVYFQKIVVRKVFYRKYIHDIDDINLERLINIKNESLFSKDKVRYCCCHRSRKYIIEDKLPKPPKLPKSSRN